jgi:serine/threonine-protein kinase HipA
VCAAPAVAGRELLRQLAFAYLTGNGDAHAKNFSVVRTVDGEWRAAPAYDVPTSHPYGDTTMALSIAGQRGGEYAAADLVGLGERIGVPERSTRRALAELTDRADLWLPKLDALPFDGRTIAKLRRLIDSRRARLRR